MLGLRLSMQVGGCEDGDDDADWWVVDCGLEASDEGVVAEQGAAACPPQWGTPPQFGLLKLPNNAHALPYSVVANFHSFAADFSGQWVPFCHPQWVSQWEEASPQKIWLEMYKVCFWSDLRLFMYKPKLCPANTLILISELSICFEYQRQCNGRQRKWESAGCRGE